MKDWQTRNGLAADGVAGPVTFMTIGLHELVLLQQDARGNAVKKLQERLGVEADGVFGAGTAVALREHQKRNGLTADGVAGPATLAQMALFKGDHGGHGRSAADFGGRSRRCRRQRPGG